MTDRTFIYKGREVVIYVRRVGKRFHWAYTFDGEPAGELKGDSGAPDQDLAVLEATAHAKAKLDKGTD